MSPKRGVAPLRRAEIVRATIRCLARDGYSGLTMKKVAREAAVSQGILHYYFADKRAILVAALETVTADLDRRVAAAQSREGRDPRARLLALIGAVVAQGVRSGTFRRTDVLRAAAVILGLVDGVSLQLTFDPTAFRVAEATRFCGDAVMRYLAREAP